MRGRFCFACYIWFWCHRSVSSSTSPGQGPGPRGLGAGSRRPSLRGCRGSETARPTEELLSQAVSTKDAASFLVAFWDVGLLCFVSYFLLQWFIWVLRRASVTVMQYRKARLGNTQHTGHVSAAKLSLGFFYWSALQMRSGFTKFQPALVPLLSRVWLFVTLGTAARQASLSFTISWSFFKFMSVESVMPSNQTTFCTLLEIKENSGEYQPTQQTQAQTQEAFTHCIAGTRHVITPSFRERRELEIFDKQH